jgi:hypothetical protein
MPEKSKEGKFPSRVKEPGVAELAAVFHFGNDIAPFDSPEFRKRLGELIAGATRPLRKRSKRPTAPKRN